jgi:hypothetical protein
VPHKVKSHGDSLLIKEVDTVHSVHLSMRGVIEVLQAIIKEHQHSVKRGTEEIRRDQERSGEIKIRHKPDRD